MKEIIDTFACSFQFRRVRVSPLMFSQTNFAKGTKLQVKEHQTSDKTPQAIVESNEGGKLMVKLESVFSL